MWIAAAFITMLCFGTNNMIFKWCTERGLSKIHIQFFFYLVAFILSIGYGMMVGIPDLNLVTVLIGALIGILNAIGNIQMTKAYDVGPASLTAPLIGINTIFPIICAAFIFHEQITLIQWFGIVLILGSALVIQYSSSTSANKNYGSWLIRVILAICSFGILGILMKTSTYLHIDSIDTLICMYGAGTTYLAINSVVEKEKWNQSEVKIGALVGLLSVTGYGMYFFALNTGTASIVFPIVSLNCLVVILGGCWFYRERLKIYQVFGVLSALIGIIFTKI